MADPGSGAGEQPAAHPRPGRLSSRRTAFAIQINAANNQLESDRVALLIEDAEALVLHEWNGAPTPYPAILATIVRNAAARGFYNPAQDEQVGLGEFSRRPRAVYLREDEKAMIAEARRRALGTTALSRVRGITYDVSTEATVTINGVLTSLWEKTGLLMLALGGALLAGGIPSLLATSAGPSGPKGGGSAPVATATATPGSAPASAADTTVPGRAAAIADGAADPPVESTPPRRRARRAAAPDAATEADTRTLRKQLGGSPVRTPARVLIPRLRLDEGLVGLGVLPDGSLEAPAKYGQVGWWQDGPAPGTEGALVLVGHRDSPTGPAVFYRLDSLRPGDTVQLYSKDRTQMTFRIREVEQFPRDRFPSDRVYRRTGAPGLVLLTCGGQYDRAAGRYLDNVVVFADLVGKPRT